MSRRIPNSVETLLGTNDHCIPGRKRPRCSPLHGPCSSEALRSRPPTRPFLPSLILLAPACEIRRQSRKLLSREIDIDADYARIVTIHQRRNAGNDIPRKTRYFLAPSHRPLSMRATNSRWPQRRGCGLRLLHLVQNDQEVSTLFDERFACAYAEGFGNGIPFFRQVRIAGGHEHQGIRRLVPLAP